MYVNVSINGKPAGLKFNQMAYITFYKFIDLENFEATFHYAAVYAGLISNSYVKREEFTTTFEQVCEWVDEMSDDEKVKVVEAFNSTVFWKKLVDVGKNADDKEKPNEQKKRKMKTILKSA